MPDEIVAKCKNCGCQLAPHEINEDMICDDCIQEIDEEDDDYEYDDEDEE